MRETAHDEQPTAPTKAPVRAQAAAPTPAEASPGPDFSAALAALRAGLPAQLSPSALPALQRALGNRIIAEVLAAESHRHGDDCGHRPPIQRATAHDVLRTPGSPLAEPVRADMEARLGADFSDVRLHTGPAAQRSAGELGARAFTSGHHIVVGAGGADRHTLAHELTHVIQQRRGPVAGQDNGQGLRVSDPSDAFEREAESVATRVMSKRDTAAPQLRADTPAGAAPPAGVVQRSVAAQVHGYLDEHDVVRVGDFQTSGRPDSPHSEGTMGDHTTAYIVQEDTLRRLIVGQTAGDAANAIIELFRQLDALPGAALAPAGGWPSSASFDPPAEASTGSPPVRSDSTPTSSSSSPATPPVRSHSSPTTGVVLSWEDYSASELRRKYMKAYARALEQLQGLTTIVGQLADKPEQQMPALQQVISAYLHFREMVPLSTINVAAISPGLAGKGHNEGPFAAALRSYDPKADLSPERQGELQEAMWRLFDSRAVAQASTEFQSELFGRVAPGLREDLTTEQRSGIYIEQHLASIAMAYPDVVQAAYDGGLPQARVDMAERLGPMVAKCRETNVGEYQSALQSQYIQLADNRKGGSTRYEMKSEAGIRAQIGYLIALIEKNGGTPAAAPAEPEVKLRSRKPTKTYTVDWSKDKNKGNSKNNKRKASSSSVAADAKDAEKPSQQNGDQAQAERQRKETGPLTSQLILNTKGVISEFRSQGRSQSPFSGTMGAHTTAWVVHLDAVSADIVGKTVPEAMERLPELVREALAMHDRLAHHFDSDEPEVRLRRDPLLAEARENMVDLCDPEDLWRSPPVLWPLRVQSAITAILTYMNFIPGATVPGNPDGNNEARHRKVLREHGNGKRLATEGQLREAIIGLLDAKKVPAPQLVPLSENHFIQIGKAYPAGLAASGFTKPEDIMTELDEGPPAKKNKQSGGTGSKRGGRRGGGSGKDEAYS